MNFMYHGKIHSWPEESVRILWGLNFLCLKPRTGYVLESEFMALRKPYLGTVFQMSVI